MAQPPASSSNGFGILLPVLLRYICPITCCFLLNTSELWKNKKLFFVHLGPAQLLLLLQVSTTTGGPSCNLPQAGDFLGEKMNILLLFIKGSICVCVCP